MQVLIVTGMSGSGKSSVMDVMEDIGFYCIDNIPPKLISQFVDLCRQSETKISRIAVAVDVRTGDMFSEIYTNVKKLKRSEDVDVKVLFLEANHDAKTLFLDLGTGMNTPGIIKFPFWKMTREWPDAFYVCINLGNAYVPERAGISGRSLCINEDIGEVLRLLV